MKMALVAWVKERDLKFGEWSKALYDTPHSNKSNGTSVHRSQLEILKEKIFRLSVRNPDGSSINIDEPEGRLKFAFTGGNDDPSIEIHLMQFGPSPHVAACPSTVIYKFTVFPESGRDVVYHDRQVHMFPPPERVEQSKDSLVEEKHRGPTNFTESLYDLRWEPFAAEEVGYVKLSWRSKRMTTFGLSLVHQASPEYAGIARMFSSIAEHSTNQLDRPGIYHRAERDS